MPGCDASKSPFNCSSVFICGLPTIATLTVPVVPPPAGLALGGVVGCVAAAAWAVVGLAAGAAGAFVGAGACAPGAHAAASRLTATVNPAADRRQAAAPTVIRGAAFIPAPSLLPRTG